MSSRIQISERSEIVGFGRFKDRRWNRMINGKLYVFAVWEGPDGYAPVMTAHQVTFSNDGPVWEQMHYWKVERGADK